MYRLAESDISHQSMILLKSPEINQRNDPPSEIRILDILNQSGSCKRREKKVDHLDKYKC